MAIPTQFSVTSTRTSPIANPNLPQDPPRVAEAENVSIVDGADVLSSLSSAAINAPTEANAETAVVIRAPSEASSRSAAPINAPSEANAESVAGIDAPSALNSLEYGTNLFTYSEQFENVDWGKNNVTATDNTSVAPNGTLTACRLIENTADGEHYLQQSSSVTEGQDYTFSAFVKPAAGTNDMALRFAGGIVASVRFDLQNGVVVNQGAASSASIKRLSNGWFRVQATVQAASSSNGIFRVQLLSSSGLFSYTGDGISGIFVWGAQLEQSASANQYARTEATPKTVASPAEKPSVASVLPSANVDAPTEASAQPSESIETPTARTAKSAAATPTPIEAAAESSAPIDAPSAASVLPSADIDAPSEATAKPAATASAPSTLTAKAGTPTTPPFPLNHARILYENKLQQYISVSDNSATGTALNALKPNSFERWSFTGNNSIIIDLTDGTEIDTICIGGHNLAGAFVRVLYTVSSGEFLLESFAPETNAPIMAHSPNLLGVDSVRIEVTATGDRFAAYISAGVALQMQRPFFNGHTPITDADVTNYYHNKTESGNIIGQAIRSQGYKTEYSWQNIDDTWYREYFAPFKQAIKTQPFFIAWNLLEYPQDVGFGRVSQDISTSMQNGTVTKRGGLSFELLGF